MPTLLARRIKSTRIYSLVRVLIVNPDLNAEEGAGIDLARIGRAMAKMVRREADIVEVRWVVFDRDDVMMMMM